MSARVHIGYTTARAAASSRSATSSSWSAKRCPYRSRVMVADLCPSICCTTFTLAPDAMASDAAVWRIACGCMPVRPSEAAASVRAVRWNLCAGDPQRGHLAEPHAGVGEKEDSEPLLPVAAFGGLGVALQTEPQRYQHPGHGPVRNRMPHCGQHPGQVAP